MFTKDEVEKLRISGIHIIREIISELNDINDNHIRKSNSKPNELRRETDFDEICVALGLYSKKLRNGDMEK